MAHTGRNDEKFARNLSHHRSKFIRYLRCTECLPDVKDILGLDDGTVCKIHQKSFTSGESDANELFLFKFEQSTAPGKWTTFMSTLENFGYEMLTKLLKGERVCRTREIEVTFIELINRVISHKLDPKDINYYLLTAGCLSRTDVENIERRTRTEGEIAGAKLLLDRVTRRKDDWFREFMTALHKAGRQELMREVEPWFAEKLINGRESEDQSEYLLAELPDIGLESYSENSKDSLSTDDIAKFSVDQNSGTGGRCSSPTLARPKELILRDYQQELFSQVSRNENTAVICPINSGKRFVALKLIQDQLSRATIYKKKVLYLVTTEKISDKVWRRCQVFLSHISSIDFSVKVARQLKRRLSDVVRENQIVVITGELFCQALKQGSVRFDDFSLVILELDIDYYLDNNHVYKQIMPYYKNMDKKLRKPQVVLLSTSLAGGSLQDSLMTPSAACMRTCGDFSIQRIAIVQKNIDSLQQSVSMPLIEIIHVDKEHNNKFDEIVQGLMLPIENSILGHPALNQCSPLTRPPSNKKSKLYHKWLKDTRNVSRHRVPKQTIDLLEIYHGGLKRNARSGMVYASWYMLNEVSRSTNGSAVASSCNEFKDIVNALSNPCIEDPIIRSLKEKLLQLYRSNSHRNVLIVGTAIAIPIIADTLNTMFKLTSVGNVQVTGYNGGAYRPVRRKFNVLVANLYFKPVVCEVPWDCVIGVDILGYILTVLQHEAPSERPRLSQFTYPGAEPPSHVDLYYEYLMVRATTWVNIVHKHLQPM